MMRPTDPLAEEIGRVNRITVRGIDGSRRSYTLHDAPLVIGRDPKGGVCLEDSQVSWKHAALIHENGACVIEDLGSSNGTYIGNRRIQRQPLNPGEIVRIGPFEITLQAAAAPSPTSASEHTMFDVAAVRSLARQRADKPPTKVATAPVAPSHRTTLDRFLPFA